MFIFYLTIVFAGTEMLQEKTGYLCRCCNRFLSSSADAKTHCRSQFHYDKYTTYMNTKVTIFEHLNCITTIHSFQVTTFFLHFTYLQFAQVTNELQSPKRIGNEVASPIKKDSTEKVLFLILLTL